MIKRCKSELPYNHNSFEILVSRYKDLVYTLCYRFVGKPTDAEDLTQEVFTKVYLNFKHFEERSKFSSWIYRIAHNQCMDHINRRKREFEIIGIYTEEKRRQLDIQAPDDLSNKMQDSLTKISPDQRGILIMKYVLGLDLLEISESLGLTVGAVKMRLKRAREEFKDVFEE